MPDPLDLSRDNRIKALLETRAEQLAIIRRAEGIKREAEAEIRDKLGQPEEAFTNDWTIELRTVSRREYTVPAQTYRVLRARRLEPPSGPEEEPAGEPRPREAGRARKATGGLGSGSRRLPGGLAGRAAVST